MAQIETLQIGCCCFRLRPLTSKWHTWYYSARELLRRAEAVGGDWGTNVTTILLENRIPESWNGCRIILPRAVRWVGRGLRRHRYVSVFQRVGGEWKLGEWALRDGFGRDDFVLSAIDPSGNSM